MANRILLFPFLFHFLLHPFSTPHSFRHLLTFLRYLDRMLTQEEKEKRKKEEEKTRKEKEKAQQLEKELLYGSTVPTPAVKTPGKRPATTASIICSPLPPPLLPLSLPLLSSLSSNHQFLNDRSMTNTSYAQILGTKQQRFAKFQEEASCFVPH